ncbi:hypothetical protein [Solibacillus sp. FSL H8-0538]|uniref:hypothetical protein n=1 Tax=Solibacillus sp. FSL H8-0538 TaxID=2921400 RepID=UPI0030FAA34C
MLIYSLSGPSGTGKSTSALQFAHTYNIDAIIDDGLLIVGGEKRGGTSAKFEKNTVTAVRRAIFQEDWHKEDVKKALAEANVAALLIIGTSDKMTKKIAKRLELGDIDHFHYINDVRTNREIQMARFIRETQGKHLMPIPHRQVEQNFFNRLIQKGVDIFSNNREKLGETTIVRPDFHQETINIVRSVYVDVITYTVEQHPYVTKLDNLQFTMVTLPRISLTLHIAAPVNYDVGTQLKGLQAQISQQFFLHFNIEPDTINITVKGTEKKNRL